MTGRSAIASIAACRPRGSFSPSSQFWFPAPERPDPLALEFLAMEREYLAGDWTLTKILLGLLVPISLAALGFAFWKRSVVFGLVLINAIVLIKLGWSIYFGDDTGGLTLLPSRLAGLVICNAAVLYVGRRMRRGPRLDRSPAARPHAG